MTTGPGHPRPRSVRVVLLDRDGTIVAAMPEGHYLVDPADAELLPGVGDAIATLNARGVHVAVVTNQRGIALGVLRREDVEAVHRRIAALLAAHGARVDAWYVCPHADGTCRCRKPEPGLLSEALAAARVGPEDAAMVGDTERDVAAGRALGVFTVRVGPGPADTAADRRAADLPSAVEILRDGLPA